MFFSEIEKMTNRRKMNLMICSIKRHCLSWSWYKRQWNLSSYHI